jgi:hypothetical protein
VAIGRGDALGGSPGGEGEPVVVGAGSGRIEEAAVDAPGLEELGSGPAHAAMSETMTTSRTVVRGGSIGIILQRSGRVVAQP